VDQLNCVFKIRGTPDDTTLSKIASPSAQEYIRRLPASPKVPLARLLPNAKPKALDLLERLLDYNPATRITAQEALRHPYISSKYAAAVEDDIMGDHRVFDFSFEKETDIPGIKAMILDEYAEFKKQLAEQGGFGKLPRPPLPAEPVSIPSGPVPNTPNYDDLDDIIVLTTA